MKRVKTATIDVTERDSEETKLVGETQLLVVGHVTQLQCRQAKRFGAMSEGLPNIKLFFTKSDAPVSLLSSESADLKKLKKDVLSPTPPM